MLENNVVLFSYLFINTKNMSHVCNDFANNANYFLFWIGLSLKMQTCNKCNEPMVIIDSLFFIVYKNVPIC